MEALDLQVARSVAAIALMERALHEATGWEMRWGPWTVAATRVVHEDGVEISATFPEVCYIIRPDPQLVLLHRGDVVGVRDIEFPGDNAFRVSWTMRTAVTVAQ